MQMRLCCVVVALNEVSRPGSRSCCANKSARERKCGVRSVVGRVSTQLKTFYDPRLVLAVG